MDDLVKDQNGNILFEGSNTDVKAYLETPGNMGDTTRAQFGDNAVEPFTNAEMYATEYLTNYDAAYPNG